jgi:hypothetical protein
MSVSGTVLLCDTSRGRIRPLVPLCDRQMVFAAVHGLAHPGWATRRLISFRFVWRGLAADINRWCRDCQNCSRGKVTRQPAAAPVAIEIAARFFIYVLVDLVGLLQVSAVGFNYVSTMIDRSTRWVEAVPLRNMEASTCAEALIAGWASRYGVPATITSDRDC